MDARHRRGPILFPVICAAAGFLNSAEKTNPGATPAFDWESAAPESQAVSSALLKEFQEHLASINSSALFIVRHDKIILEWYGAEQSATKTHYSASMAKALVGGMSAALIINDGLISLDDPAAKFIPQWRQQPRKDKITLRQLGSHTSGLADAEEGNQPHEQLAGWKGDFWKRLPPPRDPFTISRDLTPLLFEPGEGKQYSNPGIAMLGYALTAAIQARPERDLRILLRERVMRPIGVPDEEWAIGYGKTFEVDRLPLVASWGAGSFTARAVARIARLMLRGGDWDGKPLIASNAVQAVTRDAGTPGNGGIGWWSNNDGTALSLPRDAFWGAGAGHQIVLVVPSMDLIAVRNGEALSKTAAYAEALNDFFFAPLMKVMAEGSTSNRPVAPYPASALIRDVRWAPRETIIRLANGSDNWPITWADDDSLYAAYGDGGGFAPASTPKLSLGLARIRGTPGTPGELSGENIRSPSLEQLGEGAAGKKASGLLMVEGVLYLWARNAANARLAWSSDHGLTWSWASWAFTNSFGCPTFLNFEKNYAGARDGYVYIYSHDSDSAYQSADRMVLARVAKDQIRRREAYEFFEWMDPLGQPVWGTNIARRGAVFVHPGKCYRSGISYAAGLGRYLWCQTLPGGDARYQGGFGIFDAPEPWGPWTTVFYTEHWDVGPGETSSFPTKWIQPDGRVLWLLFSGEDSFSVRKAEFVLQK